jgi:hypothetical protein
MGTNGGAAPERGQDSRAVDTSPTWRRGDGAGELDDSPIAKVPSPIFLEVPRGSAKYVLAVDVRGQTEPVATVMVA